MIEEAQPGNRVDHALRRPRREEIQHQRESGEQERKAHNHGEDERDHLVARARRDARGDGEKGSGHQETADVAGQDHAVVGRAEIVDRDPDRKREHQRDADERPCREELADHGLPHRDRHGQQQFDRSAFAFFRPQTHADGGNQEQVQPRMEIEKRQQVGLAALVEIAEVKRERAGEQQEDHDEHIGDRRGEVARQFPFEDRDDVAHARASCPLPCVIVRNTSSRRPLSSCSSLTATPCACRA